jgi:hypothetical protein
MCKHPIKTLFLALCFPLLLAQGCSKEDPSKISEKAEIEGLKILLSEITTFPVAQIVYKENEQAFYYMNVMQITKERLLLIQEQRNNNK